MKEEDIARMTHEVNRVWCEQNGDYSQPNWHDAPSWQKESAINGVRFHIENNNLLPIDSHDNWLKEKLKHGWKYGPIKDAEKKEHPCMVPYHMLPIEQRIKDKLFIAVVRALESEL